MKQKIMIICIALLVSTTGLCVQGIPTKTQTNRERQDIPNSNTDTRSGNIIYVGGSGPNNYTTIQGGINQVNPGGTVFVYDDSSPYYENIIVNKPVTLIGENKETTIIDGGHVSGDVVSVSAADVSISGFTVVNSGDYYYDSGIKITSDNNKVFDSIILHNEQGISIESSDGNVIEDNILVHNQINNTRLIYANNNIINRNTINGSSSSFFGVALGYSNNNTITNNTIRYNLFYGIISLPGSNNIIRQNDICDNNEEGISDLISHNIIYHNNLVNNTENVGNYYSSTIWDGGYPVGGNYWSDYSGVDQYQGQNQDIPGPDGIGDTPYIIYNGNNQEDHYPLMHRFVLGDMNGDGSVDFGDINPFVLALCDPALYQTTFQMFPSLHGDINQDGELNFGDINPFVALLTRAT